MKRKEHNKHEIITQEFGYEVHPMWAMSRALLNYGDAFPY